MMGSTFFWDHEECPRDDCEGELQQQDEWNVICLECETVWAHYTDATHHELVDENADVVTRKRRVATDGGTDSSDTGRSADEWEQYLEEHPDEVLMFVDEDYEIHTFEHDQEGGELCFLRGGTYGYGYGGSRAALEAFAEDDSDVHKLVPRDEEYAERERLTNGEFGTPVEWVEA